MMWDYNGNYMFIYGFVILTIIAILVANDAASNGRNGLLWGLVTLFMPMMGLLIYLVVRNFPVNQGLYPQTTPPVRATRSVVYQPIQPASTGAQVADGKTQYCTSCGAPNKAAALYCNSCGSAILGE